MDIELQLNTLLADTYRALEAFEEKMMKKSGQSALSINEIHAIEIISRDEGRTITDIANDLGLTLSSVTTAVARLEKKGFVERKRISSDRRHVHVFLTENGDTINRLHKRFHKRMTKQMLEGFSQEEVEALLRAITRLNSYFKAKSAATEK